MTQYQGLSQKTTNMNYTIEKLVSKVSILEEENVNLKEKINELIGITNNLSDYIYLELRNKNFILRIGITQRNESIILNENTTEFTTTLFNSLNLCICIKELYLDEFSKLKYIDFFDLDLILDTVIYLSIYHKHKILYNGQSYVSLKDKITNLILIGFFDIFKSTNIKYSINGVNYMNFSEIISVLPQYIN
jgi:hypothetical protein